MTLARIGPAALALALASPFVAPAPFGGWMAIFIAAAFVALTFRGVASMRSGLVEPTVWRSPDPGDRRVALTFDDGPHPVHTPRVLGVLRERGVRATFFVVGANARRHPEIVRRIAEEGHDVGAHGDSHSPRTAFFRPQRMQREIEACLAAVRAATGRTPRLWRPPYGLRSPAHTGLAGRLDLVVVGMARRGHDKDAGVPAADVAARTPALARPGEILALHDGDENGREDAPCAAAEALPAILDGLAARGLEPVPVSALVGERPWRESPQRAWTGRTHGGRAGNWFFEQLVRFGGARAGLALLVFVAAWFVAFKPAQRRASFELRRRIRGPAPGPVLAGWAWRHFFVFGRTLLWRLASLREGAAPPRIEYEGYDRVRDLVDAPGPLLLVSAHVGDWSGAGRRLVADERRALHVVAFRGTGLGPHQMNERAGGPGFSLIDVEGGSERVGIEIASALARGDAVAIHADRTMDDEHGVPVPFLGGTARFPAGVWKVAMVTGAPAIVYFAIPLAADLVRILVYGPIRVPRVAREHREEAVRAAAGEFARHLEDCVRRHPLHWGNFHDVWGGP